VCACFLEAYCEAQLDELEARLPVRNETFERFRLDAYSNTVYHEWGESPRQNASTVYDECRTFAERFETEKKGIFLNGGPGTGKTFLASCIAAALSARGFSVLYRSSVELFPLYERGKFTYDDEIIETVEAELRRIYECDLFILDDLGAEMKSQLVNTSLYALLTARAGKKTIICSGLDELSDLPRRYSPQIVSRMHGNFITLPLFGDDLRDN